MPHHSIRHLSVPTVLRGLAYAAIAASVAVFVWTVPAHAETQTRAVAPFKAIAMGGFGDLEVTVGATQSVELEGDADMLAFVKTDVRSETLSIDMDDVPRSFNNAKLTIRVTLPKLTGFVLAGSGDTTITGFDGGPVSIAIAGSGDLTADGAVDELQVIINGSGEVDAEDLAVAGDVTVVISGSGSVTVQPHGSLLATINGSGDIVYTSEPTSVTSIINGSGDVSRR